MFKYYISVPFHCFTQYYGNKKRYHEILWFSDKFSIFLCALYKKCGVGNHAPEAIYVPNRFAVHCCLVRLYRSRFR